MKKWPEFLLYPFPLFLFFLLHPFLLLENGLGVLDLKFCCLRRRVICFLGYHRCLMLSHDFHHQCLPLKLFLWDWPDPVGSPPAVLLNCLVHEVEPSLVLSPDPSHKVFWWPKYLEEDTPLWNASQGARVTVSKYHVIFTNKRTTSEYHKFHVAWGVFDFWELLCQNIFFVSLLTGKAGRRVLTTTK